MLLKHLKFQFKNIHDVLKDNLKMKSQLIAITYLNYLFKNYH